MSVPDGLLKIGDFARRAETNLRTLRYYEELGLILPAARSAGGFRYYRPTDVNRVRLIRNLQELGLQLDQIAQLLGSRDRSPTRSDLLERVRQALTEQDRLLRERIELLQAQRAEVDQALVKLGDCQGCGRSPSNDNNFCEPCERSKTALPDLLSALF